MAVEQSKKTVLQRKKEEFVTDRTTAGIMKMVQAIGARVIDRQEEP